MLDESAQFESLLKHAPAPGEAPQALQADLHLAQQLRSLDLSDESHTRARLRAQRAGWLHHPAAAPAPGPRPAGRRALWLGALIAVLLVTLLGANTPARAAFQRFLGYGYLPYAGFIRLADVRILQGPVGPSAPGQAPGVLQGVAGGEQTTLWVSAGLDPAALSAAELLLPDGSRLPVRQVEAGADALRLAFAPLPGEVSTAELALPGSWRLPLAWIPADQAGLAPTQVSLPLASRTPSASDAAPCVDLATQARLCATAAFVDAQGTHLLLQGLQAGQAAPIAWNPAAQHSAVYLEGTDGRIYPLAGFDEGPQDDPSLLALRFTSLPATLDVVRLYLPAQAVTWAGALPAVDATLQLDLRLPARLPLRSPTPGAPAAPASPAAIPTPGP
ncbi:MAG: hypothetical protein VB089_06440 [Anaerolineaceae bacterium]|nr:hypothetical protein [Anaerolineaceae bacterium]